MATIVNLFGKRGSAQTEAAAPSADLAGFLTAASLEVMPRTAAKVEDFRAIMPAGARLYIAHLDGTPFEDMEATARRLVQEGFEVMPHIPARIVPDRAALDAWLGAYADLGITQALVLGGGLSAPKGAYHSSIELMETGLFEAHGFTRLHVAGHPEGNKDIDPKGGDAEVMKALRWKQDFAAANGVDMAIVTQFAFEADPIIAWAERLAADGITLPIHIGLAGPAKLQTLIKFAIACGVGPSLRVLQRRAADVTKLLMPFEPTELSAALAAHKAANPEFLVSQAHIFPLGGIKASATWLGAQTASGVEAARA